MPPMNQTGVIATHPKRRYTMRIASGARDITLQDTHKLALLLLGASTDADLIRILQERRTSP